MGELWRYDGDTCHRIRTLAMPYSIKTDSTGSPAPESNTLVLIAEDEPEIMAILKAYLARHGLRSAHAPDGRAALDMHETLKPDLVLLDVKMPKLDGWQVLAELRRRGDTPVIMLTAHDQDIDKLMALRIGADDYVVKPFNPAEVVARVTAVLRRCQSRPESASTRLLRRGPLEIDLDSYQVTVDQSGQRSAVPLTLTEFRLLTHLARAPKRVFSREELLAACLAESNALERTVDSHISKLRKKLESAGVSDMPVSLRGVGYRLEGHD